MQKQVMDTLLMPWEERRKDNHVSEEEDSGDWIEGTGISSRTGARAEEAAVAAAGAVTGAGAGTDEAC